ncbi:MAG: transporter substrate-binding domain-containing protein [Alphaproteobacteria bacterium]|nr:transporter substrate-binding domain-containing protein [Alphaproteobacteria bacterium]
MKLNHFFTLFFVLSMIFPLVSHAAEADDSITRIKKRGVVYCGTNRNNHDLAYKDEDGIWRGFDASLCRALAAAFLDNKEQIEMIPISIDEVPNALHTGKIDLMFGEFPLPAETEISTNTINLDVLYNEKVMLLAHKKEEATSLEDYRDSTICVVKSSVDSYLLSNFMYRYDLNLKPVSFATRDRAIEGFYLNRCALLPGASNELRNIMQTKMKGKDYIELLPEVIGLRPVYLIADKNSLKLGIAAKWIVNALRLAEDHHITSENLPMMLGDKDLSVQNLLGNQTALWKKFRVYPQWMRQFIIDEGNFGEMYNRHLGPGTMMDLDPHESEQGLAKAKPFI